MKNLKSITVYTRLLIMVVCFAGLSFGLKSQPFEYWGGGGGSVVMGTTDSRMVANVVEMGDSIKVEVLAIGYMQAYSFYFSLSYDTTNLMLVNNSFQNRISYTGTTAATTPIVSPAVTVATSTLANQGGNYSLSFGVHNPIIGTPKAFLDIEIGNNASNYTSCYKLAAHQVNTLFTVFLKKKTTGIPLQPSNLGIYLVPNPKRSFGWTMISTELLYKHAPENVYYGDKLVNHNNPDLFAFRWTSDVKTETTANITATMATLNGSFTRGKFNPNTYSVDRIDARQNGVNPVNVNNTLLDWDTVIRYGFIYSKKNWDITTNPFSKKITISNGVGDYEITSTDLTNGYFIPNGVDTLWMVYNHNTYAGQTFPFSKNITGLAKNTEYCAWAFMQYAFQTSTDFIAVGERDCFKTLYCEDLDRPFGDENQKFCLLATVADLLATPSAGSTLTWYQNGIALPSTHNLINGEKYYAKSVISSCAGADSVAVTVNIINGILPPLTSTPQRFCTGVTISDLQATGLNVMWYDAATGGNMYTGSELLKEGLVYYASQTIGNCESNVRTAVKVVLDSVTVLDAPKIHSPQYFCNEAKLTDIATDGSPITWYSAEGALLPDTTYLYNGTTYYAARNIGECESADRTAVLVFTGLTNIATPELSTPQRFCFGATIADIDVPNNQIVWYASETDYFPLSSDRLLSDNGIYYAAQKAGECESSGRAAVQIFFHGIQGPDAQSTQLFCGTGFTLGDIAVSGRGIVWYDAMENGNALPSNTPLTSIPTMYYAAQSTAGCESSRAGVVASVGTSPVVSITPAGANMPVGSSQILTISDDNTNTSPIARRMQIADPSIASAIMLGDTILVRGKSEGITEITYISTSEDGCETIVIIPVQVGTDLPTGILTGKDIIKCNVPGGGDTTIVQLAYIMGGVSPWRVTISDDRGTFTIDTLIQKLDDLPIDITVIIPENMGNVPEFTEYTITNITDAVGNSKQTHYGRVRIGTNPTPRVSTIANKTQTVCADANTLPVSFNGVATVYRCYTDENIGVMNFMDDAIGSFKAINETTKAITATIVVIPEYWYNGVICFGEPDTAYITVLPKVVADFTMKEVCIGQRQFTDASTGNAVSWFWNFGDGTTDIVQSPLHRFSISGPYVVTLTITTSDHCSATVSRTIVIDATTDLEAKFMVDNATQCLNENAFRFVDQSRITEPGGHKIGKWLWNFGDGNTDTASNPIHTYNNAGTYLVTLTVTATELPCTQTSVTHSVTVTDIPVVYDTVSVAAVCDGALLRVTVPEIDWKGNVPVTGEWLLDGEVFNPLFTHVTTADSGKLLQYRVSVECGIITGEGATITVNAIPVADFSTEVTGNGEITFTDASTNAASWSWNFGDSQTSTEQNPVHTYAQEGTFDVTLTVTTTAGCIHSITKQVDVNKVILRANFEIDNDAQCLANNKFIFTNTSTLITPNHSIDSVSWDFGDGSPVVNTPNATHTYAEAGIYDVVLTIRETPGGQISDMTKAVYVTGIPVVYDTAAVTAVCDGSLLSVTVPEIDWKGNAPVQGEWLLDGKTFNPLMTHVTTADNGKLLQYRVSVTCGIATGDGVTITVNALPVADYSWMETGLGERTFTDASTGNVTEWSWNFGDGSILSTEQNPVHAYAQTGRYNVTLTVTNTEGCTSTITKPVYIDKDTAIRADFNINIEEQCLEGNEFIFKDMSTVITQNHNISEWKWYFGDGDSSTTKNPVHSYTQSGYYDVTLIVTETPGKTQASMTKRIKVLDVPVVYDTAAVAAVCVGEYLQVAIPDIEWHGNTPVEGTWLLGGYIFDPLMKPVTLLDDGKLLQYRVPSACGDAIGTGTVITVYEHPVADFSWKVTGVREMTFTNVSTDIVSWSWNFGDGSALSTDSNPAHIYEQAGLYYVTLTVTNAGGCTSTVTKPVIVSDVYPIPDFTINNEIQCLANNTFIFRDISIMLTPNHYIDSYKWYFGNGDSAMTKNATYTYTEVGVYEVMLVITEMPGGTQANITHTIRVIDRPSITDAPYIPPVCEGDYLQVSMPDIEWNGNIPVAGMWMLDGYIFDPLTRVITYADNGKLLQYRLETFCGVSISRGVTITVNPKPVVTQLLNETYCAGTPVAEKILGTTPGVTYQWRVTGADIGLNQMSGTDTIPEFIATNETDRTITATFEVIPFGATCQGEAMRFSITVEPRAIVISGLTAASICSESRFDYTITSNTTGARFYWHRLPNVFINNGNTKDGTSSQISETLINRDVAPVVVEYVIETTSPVCTQIHYDTLRVTVIPKPNVFIDDIISVRCSGETVPAYYFSGNVGQTQYIWEQTGGSNIGLALTGGVDIMPQFITVNTTLLPLMATYKVTPIYIDGNSVCYGDEKVFSITVNPEFAMTSAKITEDICSESSFSYIITANVTNAVYQWHRPAIPRINNGDAANGIGQIITETLYNFTATPITVTYLIDITYNGCTIHDSVKVIVKPTPDITIQPIIEVCGMTNEVLIPYQSDSQIEMTYSIIFTQDALLAGFTHIVNQPLTGDTIRITLPGLVREGVYGGTLTVSSLEGCQSQTAHPFLIQVLEGARIVEQPQKVALCDDAGFTLTVKAIGKNLSYQWFKDGVAITGAVLPSYSVAAADVTDYGAYYVEIYSSCGVVVSDEAEVGLSGLTLFMKLGDVIAIANSDLSYMGYQWYRDGVPIGKDGQFQYYSKAGGLPAGVYQLYVFYADGTGEMSCPYTVTPPVKQFGEIAIYPNPVISNGEVTIDVSKLANSDFEHAKLVIFDVYGKMVIQSQMSSPKETIYLDLAKGVYLVRLITDQDEMITRKIVVY